MSSIENRSNVKKLTDAEIEEYLASPYSSNSFKINLEFEKVRRQYKGTEDDPRGFARRHKLSMEVFGFKIDTPARKRKRKGISHGNR